MFSVLMSVYAKETPLFLKESLQSVFKQSLMPFEVVLVKDGPLTTELNAVVEDFKNKYPVAMKIISLKENVGLGKALSLGLLECSNDYVARMDSDDICDERRFELQYNFMIEHPEIDIVGSNISEFLDSWDTQVSERIVHENHEDIIKTMKYRSDMNHVTVMFKKNAVITSGSYKDFKIEDYQLWINMIINGFKFHNLKEKLVYVRVGNDMIGRRSGFKYFKLEYKLLKQIYAFKLINIWEFLALSLIKFLVRSLPKKLLSKFYLTFMRNKNI